MLPWTDETLNMNFRTKEARNAWIRVKCLDDEFKKIIASDSCGTDCMCGPETQSMEAEKRKQAVNYIKCLGNLCRVTQT